MSALPHRIEQVAYALARQVRDECGPAAVVTGVSAFSERNDDGDVDAMLAVLTQDHGEVNEFMDNVDGLDEWLVERPNHAALLTAAIRDNLHNLNDGQ